MALSLMSFAAEAAPLARQPDLNSAPKPAASPRSKSSVSEMDNDFLQPSTADLLHDQPLLKSDSKAYPEKLPEMLPEEPEFIQPKKKAATAPRAEVPQAIAPNSPTGNLLGIPTAPAASSESAVSNNIPLDPATDSAAAMKPEVDTTIDMGPSDTGNSDAGNSDIVEFPPSEHDVIDEPLDEERLVSEPDQAPLDSENTSSVASEGTSEKKWERGIPRYDQERPSMGLQFVYSPNAVGTDIAVWDENHVVLENYKMSQFGFGIDWQPKFLQSIGVVALGATANVYPVTPLSGLTENGLDIWSVGFSAKYQAKWFRGQWVVPYAGYEAQYLNYRTDSIEIGSGSTMFSGPVLGAMLLLNWLEPKAAFEMYDNTGIKRSYLFAEWKSLAAQSEPAFSTVGQSLHFGLRFEL